MKFFSVEGANGLIPRLEAYIKRFRELRDKIFQKQVQIDTLLIVGGTAEPTTYAPSQKHVQRDVKELNELVREFNSILEEINALGCQLKDPDSGLVDFYHIRNDEIVYLCWKFGEPKIEYWHDLQKGYTGRQKL